MIRFEKDQLFSVNSHKASLEAFKCVCNFKGEPEHMFAGLSFLFLEMCSEFGVEPRSALTAARRMIDDCSFHGQTTQRGHREAIRLYIRNDILKQNGQGF